MTNEAYDVLVIGGGAAGLSGAVALARSRRSVLVVDDGTPRNAPAEGVHNFLGHDGIPPGELLAAGRAELAGYGGQVVSGRVTGVQPRAGGGFAVQLADDSTVSARRVLVTTGLVDELPEVPGLAARWGRDVLHCPYCHGWEVRDQAVGVLATGPLAVHQALLFRQLSADVVVFAHDATLPEESLEELAAVGVRVVEGEVVGLEVTDDRLTGVRLHSGEVVARDALAVQARATARAAVLAALGLEPVEFRIGEHAVGSYVPAGLGGATAVPGVWVAGNVADLQAQVVAAAAAGLLAGASINADLVAEDARLAVQARRAREAACA